jgi:O-antigen/teichoic acid export membrane protein
VLTLAVASRFAGDLSRRHAGRLPHPDPIGREFLASVAPIGVGILLSALYFRLDVFLVDRWNGTTAVALYNAVFRLIDALRLFPAAVIAVALPALCRATDARILIRTAVPLSASAVLLSIVLWFGGGWLVPALYGPAYAESVPLFRILLLALPLMFLNYALTHQIIGWHRHHAYAAICAAALAGNLLLNTLLIPRMGASGAAWATLWTEAILTAGCLFVLVRALAQPARLERERVAVGAAS